MVPTAAATTTTLNKKQVEKQDECSYDGSRCPLCESIRYNNDNWTDYSDDGSHCPSELCYDSSGTYTIQEKIKLKEKNVEKASTNAEGGRKRKLH